MFFLTSHTFVKKYHTNLIIPFVIGITCYILLFFVMKDSVDDELIDQYKYFTLALIIADICLVFYTTKCCSEPFKTYYTTIMQDTKVNRSNDDPDIILSSEINDIHIIHDTTISDSDSNISMFSISEK